jgi:Uma2 family endonuclease
VPSLSITVSKELCFNEFDSVVAPDVVVAGDRGPARLIVEVSDGAPRLDALEKPRLYARAGVEEYWHVDLAWRFIQVPRLAAPRARSARSGPTRPCPARSAS